VSYYQEFGFVPLEGVQEGLLQGESLPMFPVIGTIASIVEH
jgi:hypothetical protein